jgi:hypothetical protein
MLEIVGVGCVFANGGKLFLVGHDFFEDIIENCPCSVLSNYYQDEYFRFTSLGFIHSENKLIKKDDFVNYVLKKFLVEVDEFPMIETGIYGYGVLIRKTEDHINDYYLFRMCDVYEIEKDNEIVEIVDDIDDLNDQKYNFIQKTLKEFEVFHDSKKYVISIDTINLKYLCISK